MKYAPLPDLMLGNWIWSANEPDGQAPRQALFRRDFILDTAPSSTEIQMAARCGFQLFINGRFFACGPTSHPNGKNYICKYDVSHLMQIGANSVAVKAFCDPRPSTARPPQQPGFWLQVVTDNAPTLWTDDKWLTMPLEAYLSTDLRSSPAEPAVEILDFEKFPQNWLLLTQKHFPPDENQFPDSTEWLRVTNVTPLKGHKDHLEVEPKGKNTYELAPQPQILLRGVAYARNSVHTLDFTPIFTQTMRPGLYAAETYINLKQASNQTIYCFSTPPFKVFVNDTLALQKQCPTMKNRYRIGQPPQAPDSGLYDSQDDFEAPLEEGWNKITVVKWCEELHSPFTMIFADLLNGSTFLRRQPDSNAQKGWSITGPLRTPIQLIPEAFTLQSLPKLQFNDADDPCKDAAAISLACQYEKDVDAPAPYKLPIPLAQQQTVIFDFGKTIYAVPEIKVMGQKGDVLDLITGEHLLGAEIIALENGTRRNTSTLIIDDCPKPINWLLKENKGFRYIMLVARQTRTVINVLNINAFVSSSQTRATGAFECDDDTLNAVWKAGVATLNTTLQGKFLDSPTKDQTQCIPDSMIQSASAYVTHGAYKQAAYALDAFARTQLETGEINALTPSSFFQTIPDFSLFWPIWLQQHIKVTADMQLLNELLPPLTALLDYYDAMAIEPDGPLGNLEDFIGNIPFIDLDTIDTKGISTGLNAIYARALFATAWLAEVAENPQLQEVCQNRAAKIAATLRALTWNQDQQLYADAYDNAAQSPFSSWQTNVLAIYGGIATPEQIPVIWNQLFSAEPPYENYAQGDFNNPYFKYFILDCAFAQGYTDWGLNLIRYYWGKMLEAGATTFWELFDPDNPALAQRICSHCHGYATSPNAFLISEVAGLRPATCGMNTLIFSPDLEDVKWCRASIPTPHGTIQLAWELKVNDTLDIAISSNHPVDIIPVLSPRFAENAVFNVNDRVSILAQDESEEAEKNEETE